MNKNTEKKKKLKKIIIIISICFTVLLLLTGILAIINGYLEKNPPSESSNTSDLQHLDPDYNVNIFDDPIYMLKNRNVFYSEYETGEEITEDNYLTLGKCSAFFKNYFDIVINGEYNKYKELFFDQKTSKDIIPEKFTMQKIYDIEVNLTLEKLEQDNTVKYYFTVKYKIMNNNGTFRNNVKSDTIAPLSFTLIHKDGEYKILSITQITGE
ncbi:hypothetical protein LJB90_01340 [Eubacteriales bacterium OttesenSCG-928-G02]|nr:hypothetical protein [Eubacteriales bacterium OttesenSCG-928-G02]